AFAAGAIAASSAELRDALAKAVRDGETAVRSAALRSVAQLGRAAAGMRADVERHLKDPSWIVQGEARRALAAIDSGPEQPRSPAG
ncbi:MAG: hypothetical protein ACK4N5_07955, partial [Myxococcales bacterium]